MTTMTSVADVFEFAKQAHGEQLYDDKPYVVHLEETYEVARLFFPDAPTAVFYAAITHDVLEDTDADPLDLVRIVGSRAATLVVLVTDPEHGTRAERKQHVLRNLLVNEHAAMVKVADRLANVQHAPSERLLKLYRKEQVTFIHPLAEAWPSLVPIVSAIDAVLRRNV